MHAAAQSNLMLSQDALMVEVPCKFPPGGGQTHSPALGHVRPYPASLGIFATWFELEAEFRPECTHASALQMNHYSSRGVLARWVLT